ncbi:MAG: hypothetical protein ACJ73S_07760 [Mycobacteriales bacterium]
MRAGRVRVAATSVAGALTGLVDGGIWHHASRCGAPGEADCLAAGATGLEWAVPFTIVMGFLAMGVTRVSRWGVAGFVAGPMFGLLLVLSRPMLPGATPPVWTLAVVGAVAFAVTTMMAGAPDHDG